MDQVGQVKQRTDIVSVIGEHVNLTKAGRNYRGLCPFHSEKTPSFMVSQELQIFKCFGCGESGDVFNFLEKYEGMEFGEALKVLAEKAGIKLKPIAGRQRGEKEELYEANLLAAKFYHWFLTKHELGKKGLSYFTKERGLTTETIENFLLGMAPQKPSSLSQFLVTKKGIGEEVLVKAGLAYKSRNGLIDRFRGRVIFPIFDHRGNCVALAGRIMPGISDMAKYINSPETPVYFKSNILYGLNLTRGEVKKSKTAVVVEGELDLISPWQNGMKNLVAIKGSALTSGQAKLLSRLCERVIFAMDADFAGNEAARRAIEVAEKEGLEVFVAQVTGGKDPDEAARKDINAFREDVKNALPAWDFVVASIMKKHDLKTSLGKAQVSKEIVPILSQMEDSIVQAHFISQVAQKLDVDEEAVRAQMQKNEAKFQVANQAPAKKESQDKTRRQRLEENLLGLSLVLTPAKVFDREIKNFLATPLVKRVVSEMEHVEEGKFEVKKFIESLPPELAPRVSELLLMQEEEDEEAVKKEVEVVKKELVQVVLKERRNALTKDITRLEREGAKEELTEAMREFRQVSRQISNFKV